MDPQKRSPWEILGTQCFEPCKHPALGHTFNECCTFTDTHTHIHFWPTVTHKVSFCHAQKVIAVCDLPCVFLCSHLWSRTRVCIRAPLSAFPHTSDRNMAIDNMSKRWGSCRQRGRMCWAEHPLIIRERGGDRARERVQWANTKVQIHCRYTVHSPVQMNGQWLGLLTSVPSFYLSLLPSPCFAFSLFFRGLPAIRAVEIDFLIHPSIPRPAFLLFHTPLPLPTLRSPNRYSICM